MYNKSATKINKSENENDDKDDKKTKLKTFDNKNIYLNRFKKVSPSRPHNFERVFMLNELKFRVRHCIATKTERNQRKLLLFRKKLSKKPLHQLLKKSSEVHFNKAHSSYIVFA
jgi:hypothetical protein